MQLLVLALLIHFSHGYMDANLFQHYVRNFLNHPIDPCEDFYDHVCSVDQIDAHPHEVMTENMKKFLAPYLPLTYHRTLEIFEKSNKSKKVTFATAAEMKTEVREICSKDFSRCQQLVELFTNKETNLALEQDKEFRHQYVEAERVADEMMKKLKRHMSKSFETTQWMKTHHRVKFYQEVVQNITRVKFFDADIHSRISKVNGRIFSNFKTCVEMTVPMPVKGPVLCLKIMVTNVLEQENIIPYEKISILHHNAYYNMKENHIAVFYQGLLTFLKDRISQLGTVGFTVAHELSHAIFTFQQTFNNLVPENLDCIMKHRQQVCSTANYTCHMGNVTILEDAPDITGLALILDLFKEEAKDGFLLDGNPPDYRKEKFLFYVMGAQFCTEKLDHDTGRRGGPDEHSPKKGRLNALLMHSEVFQQSFHCKKGDRMWREPSNFCHLLRPEAVRR